MGDASTAIESLAVGLALFWLSNRYVRDNTLQSAEFNLRLMTQAIQSSLDSADDLLNWAAVDSTIRLYLDRSELTGAQTMTAYKAAQEKYLSSPLQTRILRFFITDEQERFLQLASRCPTPWRWTVPACSCSSAAGMGWHCGRTLFCRGIPRGWCSAAPSVPAWGPSIGVRCIWGFSHGHHSPGHRVCHGPGQCAVLGDGRPVVEDRRGGAGGIAGPVLRGGISPAEEQRPAGLAPQEATQTSLQLEGREYLAVRVRLEGRDAAVIQLIPENTFLQQPFWYWGLLSFGLSLIVGLSYLLQHWLKWAINRPVEALQTRIAAVGAGDFTVDRSIEWDNELGDIGRGINKLAGDIDELLASRIEDDTRTGSGIPDAAK